MSKEELRQQQKLAMIGMLATEIAHEINNYLTGIMGEAELIATGTGGDHAAVDRAREITKASARVFQLNGRVLSFARQKESAHEDVSLGEVIDTVLAIAKGSLRHHQIEVVLAIPPDLPKLRCCCGDIQQVLLNLVMNARDALNSRYPEFDGDKVLKIEASLCAEAPPHAANIDEATAGRNGRPGGGTHRRWMRITVEDHGIGITNGDRGRLFDRFFTTKARSGGTGLGLSISNRIVKDHGGLLSFDSEDGKGTKFHVDLPLNEAV